MKQCRGCESSWESDTECTPRRHTHKCVIILLEMKNGNPFNTSWLYAPVTGLLMYSLEGFLSVNHVIEFSMSKTFWPQKGLLRLQYGTKTEQCMAINVVVIAWEL